MASQYTVKLLVHALCMCSVAACKPLCICRKSHFALYTLGHHLDESSLLSYVSLISLLRLSKADEREKKRNMSICCAALTGWTGFFYPPKKLQVIIGTTVFKKGGQVERSVQDKTERDVKRKKGKCKVRGCKKGKEAEGQILRCNKIVM